MTGTVQCQVVRPCAHTQLDEVLHLFVMGWGYHESSVIYLDNKNNLKKVNNETNSED